MILFMVLVVCRLIFAALMPLTPQEAYYWGWSQFPSWSYFDHPPLATYTIALTTAWFGNTSFGIKVAAVFWSLSGSILLAKLVIDMFGDKRLAFMAILALNVSLLYSFFSAVITPDGPLLMGWIGTIWAVWRVRQTGQSHWWWLAGMFMGIAWLGKYVGVLLIGVVGAYLLLDPVMRRWLARPQPYFAVLIAVLIFSPVLFWNAQNEWVSMAFQSTRRIGQMSTIKPRFFVLLVFTQTLLLTPYLMWISISAIQHHVKAIFKRSTDPAALLLLLSAIVPLLVFTAASFRTNAKINWLLPAWWSLVVLGLQWALSSGKGMRNVWIGISTSAAILLVSLALLLLPNLPLGELNTWSGWREAAVRVDALSQQLRSKGKKTFVFSPNYKISSLIWFHRPSQERTYAQDILGTRALQYDYFPQESDLRGYSGIFVVSDQQQSRVDIAKVSKLFETMERVDVVTTETHGRKVRSVELWVGNGYKGRPVSSEPDTNPDSP